MELPNAIETLVNELNSDEAYRHAWESNINMCIVGAMKTHQAMANLEEHELYEVANIASQMFLRILCFRPESSIK